MIILLPLIVVITGLAGGICFLIQMVICTRVRSPRLQMVPMAVTGVLLLICALLWLFDIPTTVFVTGPGKLAVYDHILLAIVLAPGFIGMEAAWILHKRETAETQRPLYGKGVWYAILSVALAVCGAALIEILAVPKFPIQSRPAVILGAILLVNVLYRWIKFRQIPLIRGLVMDVFIAAGILLVEALVICLLPETIYLTFNIQTALGTSAAMYLTLAVVYQFVLNQDDRPGVYAMLRLLVQVLTGITGFAMFLWIVWYQIYCDDNKSFVMALAFLGPVLVGLLMGYLLLLRRNGSLVFEDRKAQGTVHGLLPVALLLLCFLSGAIQFSNMEYRHEVRTRLTYWDVHELETEPGKTETVLDLDLTARDQASGMLDLLREEIDGRIEYTLCGYWKPFQRPWEFKTMFIQVPADGSITMVCLNDESVSVHGVVLRYNQVTETWEEAR